MELISFAFQQFFGLFDSKQSYTVDEYHINSLIFEQRACVHPALFISKVNRVLQKSTITITKEMEKRRNERSKHFLPFIVPYLAFLRESTATKTLCKCIVQHEQRKFLVPKLSNDVEIHTSAHIYRCWYP